MKEFSLPNSNAEHVKNNRWCQKSQKTAWEIRDGFRIEKNGNANRNRGGTKANQVGGINQVQTIKFIERIRPMETYFSTEFFKQIECNLYIFGIIKRPKHVSTRLFSKRILTISEPIQFLRWCKKNNQIQINQVLNVHSFESEKINFGISWFIKSWYSIENLHENLFIRTRWFFGIAMN